MYKKPGSLSQSRLNFVSFLQIQAVVKFYLLKGRAQHLLGESFVELITSHPTRTDIIQMLLFLHNIYSIRPTSTEDIKTLFREESVAVRLFRAFLYNNAPKYIDYCIEDLMNSVDALDKPLEVMSSF